MSLIKKFFQKKKLERKFKAAGQGHHLTSSSSPRAPTVQPVYAEGRNSRQGLSAEARSAADAALQRMAITDKPGKVVVPKAGLSGRAQPRPADTSSPAGRSSSSCSRVQLEEATVKFVCELLPGVKLPREEMIGRIEEFLLAELQSEPQLASALMIQTLNRDRVQVQVCMETLCKYLDNICEHPAEEKYRKIRFGNKLFQERVATMKGAQEFMQASGFEFRQVEVDGATIDFLILSERVAQDPSSLAQIKEVLLSAEAIVPKLDRDPRLFSLQGASAGRFEGIPPEFFNLSKDDLRKQQALQKEAVEKMGMLRTKAMRERDEQRELRLYRFCYIRVKFPNNVVLQGTFRPSDRVGAVCDFVREFLAMDWVPFTLTTSPLGQSLAENEERTLAELKLVPTVVFNCEYDRKVLSDIIAQSRSTQVEYVKPELMVNLETLK